MKNFVGVLFAAAALCLGAAQSDAATFVNVATGSTGGNYYPVGAAMAKRLMRAQQEQEEK